MIRTKRLTLSDSDVMGPSSTTLVLSKGSDVPQAVLELTLYQKDDPFEIPGESILLSLENTRRLYDYLGQVLRSR